MYIPTHYAIVLVAILLLESGALFIYTLIGLVKANPLPFLIPQPQRQAPQFPAYQYGPPPMLQEPVTLHTTHTKIITTTVSTIMFVQQEEDGMIRTIAPNEMPPPLAMSDVTVSKTNLRTNTKASPASETASHTSKSSTSKQSSSSHSSSHSTSKTSKTSKKSSSSSSAKPKVVYVTSTAKPVSKKPAVVWVTSTVNHKA